LTGVFVISQNENKERMSERILNPTDRHLTDGSGQFALPWNAQSITTIINVYVQLRGGQRDLFSAEAVVDLGPMRRRLSTLYSRHARNIKPISATKTLKMSPPFIRERRL